ncbi:hypothetical protein [Chromohalobacter sp. 11-W]|uniref:hypothetical protein n=1 Tax=Chromohalobacter sp. 11-W TaxID=2994061 RepID=UPI002468F296|nr:hypothetical protein [Chromohalobacter sp. 11-W]
MSQAQATASEQAPTETLTPATLADWGERFRSTQAEARTLAHRTPRPEEISNRLRPVQGALAITIGNSFASLVTYEAAGLPITESKASLACFIRYAQLAYMSDPEVQGEKAPPQKLHNVRLSLAEYHQWLQWVTRFSDSSPQGVDTSQALKSLDGGSGNFTAPMADTGHVVDVALPCFALDAGVLERLTDGALDETFGPDQQRQRWADLSTSARDVAGVVAGSGRYGKIMALGLVFWNTVLAVDQALFTDDDTGPDWAKLIGASVSLASGGMQAIEGYTTIRTASLGDGEAGALGRAVRNASWKMTGHLLGAAAGLISVWDGIKKLTDAAHASRLGQSLSAEHGMILGSVGVLGGIATLLVIGIGVAASLVVGLFVSLVTLVFGYWLVTLVAPSVEMWINRSLVGRHQGQIQRFEDMASEQSSLEMVFQGVVVELSWEPVRPNVSQYVRSPYDIDTAGMEADIEQASQQVRINLKVRVPKLDTIELGLKFEPREKSLRAVFDWTYQKNRDSEALSLASNSEYGMTQSRGPSDRPEFTLKDKVYEAEWSHVYEKNTLTQLAELTIDFRSSDTHTFSSDSLVLKIEDRASKGEMRT